MTALCFVDTNVLIYAHDRDAGVKHGKAKRILTDLWNQENGCLSVQVLQEFFVNVTKKTRNRYQPPWLAKSYELTCRGSKQWLTVKWLFAHRRSPMLGKHLFGMG